MTGRLAFRGLKLETSLNDRDLLKFDLTFQIGRISRAELKALAGNDRTRRDRGVGRGVFQRNFTLLGDGLKGRTTAGYGS